MADLDGDPPMILSEDDGDDLESIPSIPSTDDEDPNSSNKVRTISTRHEQVPLCSIVHLLVPGGKRQLLEGASAATASPDEAAGSSAAGLLGRSVSLLSQLLEALGLTSKEADEGHAAGTGGNSDSSFQLALNQLNLAHHDLDVASHFARLFTDKKGTVHFTGAEYKTPSPTFSRVPSNTCGPDADPNETEPKEFFPRAAAQSNTNAAKRLVDMADTENDPLKSIKAFAIYPNHRTPASSVFADAVERDFSKDSFSSIHESSWLAAFTESLLHNAAARKLPATVLQSKSSHVVNPLPEGCRAPMTAKRTLNTSDLRFIGTVLPLIRATTEPVDGAPTRDFVEPPAIDQDFGCEMILRPKTIPASLFSEYDWELRRRRLPSESDVAKASFDLDGRGKDALSSKALSRALNCMARVQAYAKSKSDQCPSMVVSLYPSKESDVLAKSIEEGWVRRLRKLQRSHFPGADALTSEDLNVRLLSAKDAASIVIDPSKLGLRASKKAPSTTAPGPQGSAD